MLWECFLLPSCFFFLSAEQSEVRFLFYCFGPHEIVRFFLPLPGFFCGDLFTDTPITFGWQ